MMLYLFSQYGIYLKRWLTDPEVLNWFPMEGEKEIDEGKGQDWDIVKKQLGL